VYQEEMEAIRRQQEESEEAYVEELQRESAYLTASLQNEAKDKVSTRPKFDNPSQAMDSSLSEEQEEYSSKNCPEISYFRQHCEVELPKWMKNKHSSHDEDE
jgi:hypothetical protein